MSAASEVKQTLPVSCMLDQSMVEGRWGVAAGWAAAADSQWTLICTVIGRNRVQRCIRNCASLGLV